MDRSKVPHINDILNLTITKTQKFVLDNGIPVFYIDSGSQDVLRTDFVFDAGTWQQEKFFQAAICNSMLQEGAGKLNAEQIAETFDSLGTFYSGQISKNSASVSFYSLNKFYEKSLELVADIIMRPTFQHKEFDLKLQQRKQDFLLRRQKVETLSLLKFFEIVYGKDNPYGKNPVEEDFDRLSIDDLKVYYQKYYHGGNVYILMSGKNPQSQFPILNELFGQKEWVKEKLPYSKDLNISAQKPGEYWHIKEDALQSGIRAGFSIPKMDDKELILSLLFNTVYGGYFGSRLMQNLREDKGYTYGVSSFIREDLYTNYFIIATNVGKEHTQNAIQEIKSELENLLKEGISEDELKNVKKQFLGDFLTLFDGVFAQLDAFDDIYSLGKEYNYYEEMLSIVNNCSANELIEIGRKYFSPEKLYFAIAGARSMSLSQEKLV